MCQVHTGAYVSLLAPEETDYTASHAQERHATRMKIRGSVVSLTPLEPPNPDPYIKPK